MQLITGIHHVTAITSDAQKNIDFYAGVLGMRLIKRTVNFDASHVYHFYYGDETGQPGGVLFEIATTGPGFQIDEPLDQLGQSLKLPPAFEHERATIESALPPITLDHLSE